VEQRVRIAALDGLRGWAALSVVGYHFYVETFVNILPAPVVLALSVVCNGPLAVAVFFVLSGYVLTIGGWRAADKTPLLRLAAKRHLRLAIPVLASAVLVALLVAGHLTSNLEAARVVGREDWLGAWLHVAPDPAGVLAYSFGWVFVRASADDIVPFLWTMTTELWFSYVVLALCFCERRLPRPYLVLCGLAAAILLTHHAVAACFPLGALLALAQRDGHLRPVLAPLSAIGLVGLALLTAMAILWSTWSEWSYVVIATVLVTTVLMSRDLDGALSAPLSRALGKLSFPIYLAQFPVLVSLTSGLILASGRPGPLQAAGIGLISLAATVALAALLLPAEWLAHWAGRQLDRLIGFRSTAGTGITPVSPSARTPPAASR
jgi:peptidoglycan/LPS O-acetylase OafA/YrhL